MDGKPDEFTICRLALARQREQGASFDEAWDRTLALFPKPEGHGRDAQDRGMTLAALGRTREAWRCSYEGKPPPTPATLR